MAVAVALALPLGVGAAAPISFWFVDPTSNERVRLLTAGDAVAPPFAVEAVGTSGSIEFWLDGTRLRLENSAPFAPFGDANGDFHAASVDPGAHVLEARAYSGTQKSGTFLGTVSLPFNVDPDGPPTDPNNVSGITIPPPFVGYVRAASTEFPNETQLGAGLHPDTLQYLKPRPDVARDCTYTDSSGRGTYCTRRTTYESGGLLRQWLHTENRGQAGIFHVPTGTVSYVSGLRWTLPSQDDFVVSLVARFDDIPGRKVAYLRWCGPRIGTAGYCEDDFPEAKLDGGSCKGNAFHHHASRTTKNAYALCLDLNDFHLYQMHVRPGAFVDFYVDGVRIGHATQYVTEADSYWVGQSETYLAGQAIPFPHSAGWIEWDAYAVDLPAG